MIDAPQVISPARIRGRAFHAYSARHLEMLTRRAGLPPAERLAVRAVATVLPFRTNSHVVENLIDWGAAPDDPIYRLVFPQPDMLPAADVSRLAVLIGGSAPEAALRSAAHEIRMRLNPHPAGQLLLNAPSLHGRPLAGLQHKYPETVLFFPRQGQTCHAYCTYCFRWAQFVDEPDLKMANDDIGTLVAYLREHPEVTSVLITGGDPMIMGETVLRRYLEPLLDPRLEHLESIRIGTKSLSYWPQRFVDDPDADATLRLFGEVAASGRTLALMAHFSHPRELEPELVVQAVRRIRGTGAVIRTQGEREKPWEGYAAAASSSTSGAQCVNPGCQRWKSPASWSLSTRVRICSSRWAPRGVQRICCIFDHAFADYLDPATGRARLSYRRAAECFTANTGWTLHQLRHTRIRELKDNGCPLPVLQKITGHRSLRTLTEHYPGPSPETVRAWYDATDPAARRRRSGGQN